MSKITNRPKKVDTSLPKVSPQTKFAIGLISFLYILTVGSSGYAIYQNKHNHDGSGFSLINLLTGNSSTGSKLKNSDTAKQTSKQIAQYSAKSSDVSPALDDENNQMQVIANFLDAYLANKNAGKSQDAVVAAYGTDNLANQYHSLAVNNDLVYCDDTGKYTSSNVAKMVYSSDDGTYYNAVLSNPQNDSLQTQLKVVGQGDSTKIDQVFCPGTD